MPAHLDLTAFRAERQQFKLALLSKMPRLTWNRRVATVWSVAMTQGTWP
jgi:hypothetical protein